MYNIVQTTLNTLEETLNQEEANGWDLVAQERQGSILVLTLHKEGIAPAILEKALADSESAKKAARAAEEAAKAAEQAAKQQLEAAQKAEAVAEAKAKEAQAIIDEEKAEAEAARLKNLGAISPEGPDDFEADDVH